MKVIAKDTHKMSREEWLQLRAKSGLGGSDISVVFGCNKNKSIFQLWQEKTGQVEPKEEENEYTHFGNVLEPIVKQEFTRRTGLKVRAKNMFLQNEEYPWLTANLDGVVNDNGEFCVFEAKTASEYKKDEWEKGVPYPYMLQCQSYLLTTGYKRAYIAAIIGGNSFKVWVIERDEAMMKQIIQKTEVFWKNHVLTGIPPVADGSPATTAFINNEYKISNGKSIELPPEALKLIERYDYVSTQIANLNETKDKITNELKIFMMDNDEGYVSNRRVSWKQVNSTYFDKKCLQNDYPDIYNEYVVEKSYRRFMVA